MEKITGEIRISQERTEQIKKEIKTVASFEKQITKTAAGKITPLLEVVLVGAINLGVSDVHLETQEEQIKVRARIDGVLQNITSLSLETYQLFLSRIKLLSGIKINITDRPQDGRFSVVAGEDEIEIRTSTLPAEHGEAIVLRILNPQNLKELSKLGLRKDLLEIFQEEIKKPNGMIIVTGPTGSGKTTTLYAFLKKIQRPEIKIVTIEDPIEYHLQGISQTQVAPERGYDFVNGLKSIMRQDPNVILVGEVRDLETAKISLQAALTGHLVLTTLHTNDAAGTVARLIDLGIKPTSVAPAINVAIAQRLVRKVCKKCGETVSPSKEELKKIKEELKKLPPEIKIPSLKKIPRAKSCSFCNQTGYRGQIGIFEVFIVDDEIQQFILTSPSIAALRKMITKKGMVTMRQDGFIKILEGITTLEEAERVTKK